MVLEAGSLGPDIVLESPSSGSFYLPIEWHVSPERPTSSWGGLSSGLCSCISGTLCELSVPIWQGCFFCMEEVVLGGFYFAPPGLILQDHSLPVAVVILEECLILFPNPLLAPCFTLYGSSGPGMLISLFGRKWWSWKDCFKVELLPVVSFHVWPYP